MVKKKKKVPPAEEQRLLIETTETEAGLNWLHSMTEDHVRDKILVELFRRMQAEGDLAEFENIHGRNDKGVDFIVSYNSSVFGRTVKGVQVKSKRMRRSEGAGSLSAVRIRGECEAAMLHDFHFGGRKIRLDGIELWCSSELTDDAEQELNPPHTVQRVGLKKDRELFCLLEKYCPTLLTNVPQFAIAKFINGSKNPAPKAVRILGCQLNPSTHFIEPYFSTSQPGSSKEVTAKRGALKPANERVTLEGILLDAAHAVVCAPPLSGRSYLLEHLRCKFAELGRLCVIIRGGDVPKDVKVDSLLSKTLDFATPKQIKDLQARVGIVLLVDDMDKCPPEAREKLLSVDPKALRIVATARGVIAPSTTKVYYQAGVEWGHIVRFLRSVDSKVASGKPFVDRAKAFIQRAFASSGLPKNPFTISVMLEECQHSVGKFSTPTMGRLISRFIEHQIGSHTDNAYAVDFETKREFLTRLGGHTRNYFTIQEFEKLIGKFIEAKGHPHSITDFSNDLLLSGVFQRIGDTVEWSHPVIKEFFWTKSLISKKKLGPIIKRLESDHNTTLAALAGSQMEDATALIEFLVPKMSKIAMPTLKELVTSPELAISLSSLISDKDEENILADIETSCFSSAPTDSDGARQAEGQKPEPETRKAQEVTLSADQKKALNNRVEELSRQIAEANLHIAFNLGAVLLNARSTSRARKEEGTEAVLLACHRIADFAEELTEAVLTNSKKAKFLCAWIKIYTLCTFGDMMLGDPHLVSVFKSCLKRSTDQTKTFALLDLLLCCGEDEHNRILTELRKINHLGVTMAFYFRAASLYFFRHHREADRAALRKLLAAIRKMEKGASLPAVS